MIFSHLSNLLFGIYFDMLIVSYAMGYARQYICCTHQKLSHVCKQTAGRVQSWLRGCSVCHLLSEYFVQPWVLRLTKEQLCKDLCRHRKHIVVIFLSTRKEKRGKRKENIHMGN